MRSYDRATSTSDELEILIDGKTNDLFSDKDEEEMFKLQEEILSEKGV